MTPPNKSFFSKNASKSFKNTCLGLIGHQIFVFEFPFVIVDQILLIFLHLILEPSFFYCNRVDLIPYHRVTKFVCLTSLFAFQTCPLFKFVHLSNLSNSSKPSCYYARVRQYSLDPLGQGHVSHFN